MTDGAGTRRSNGNSLDPTILPDRPLHSMFSRGPCPGLA